MKLTELVTYFRSGGSLEEFCQNQNLNPESEVIEIYMQEPFDINNDISFFEIEKTEGKAEYNFNGSAYHNLFDFYYFQDAIEESNNGENESFTDREIAQKLFNYGIHDA